MTSPYQMALDQGMSEEEIRGYFSKKVPDFDSKYKLAKEKGLDDSEIYDYLASKQKPTESKVSTSKLPTAEQIGEPTRHAGRLAARGLETLIGMPKALGELGEKIQEAPLNLLEKGAEKIGLGEGFKNLRGLTEKYNPRKLLPSSEDVRNVEKKLFGETFEPKNKLEALGDEIFSDFVALSSGKGNVSKLRPLYISLGSNLAGEASEKLGATPKQKGLIKMGATFVGSMINPKSAENLKKEYYALADKALPTDAAIKSTNIHQNSKNVLKDFNTGFPDAPSKKEAIKLIKSIISKSKNKDFPINELKEYKKDINELSKKFYKEFKGDETALKKAKFNLDKVRKVLDDGLEEYGQTNKKWFQNYKIANEVHGAISQSKQTKNFIKKVGKKYGLYGALSLLGLGHFGGVGKYAKILGISGLVGAGGIEAGEILAKAMKSPAIRKMYGNLLKNGIKENATLVNRNLIALEKMIPQVLKTQAKKQKIKPPSPTASKAATKKILKKDIEKMKQSL